jgi:sterol desaturase/sphingolipid hydroxylase (fatty acid hydroxylase superfamily)
MFSFNSIKTFFYLNSFLVSYSFLEYFINYDLNFISTLSLIVIRNYTLINMIDYSLKDKENIDGEKRIMPKEQYYGEFHIYLLKSSIIETITSLIVENYLINYNSNSYLKDLIFFIPTSFMFEIIFDFFHYITHRSLHNKYIYTNIHKIHHKFKYPTTITTFYQHPLDLIITNTIPTIFTLYFFNKISLFQFKMLSVYKTFIEISGHSGKYNNSTSFTQCVWLAKIFNIELGIKNHDLHHSLNNCNYSKRFSLWDKVFGTFNPN